MAVHHSFLLILAGLTGIYSITTVREVSVQEGRSIIIPCLYEPQYKNNVKYLCKGYYWSSCSYALKTNQENSGKFSISDDKSRGIFTVTIKDLTHTDTDYWCAVEIDGGSDVRQYFHLSVTRGTPSLSVAQQKVARFNEEMITISGKSYNFGKMKWCKLGRSCVTEPSGSIDGAKVTISATVNSDFTVTMKGLKKESGGWYWCDKGGLQMPVHVIVNEQSTTNKTSTAAQGEELGVPFHLKSLVITLSLLVFIVMMTLFIWLMLRRCKQTRVESAPTLPKEEVIYSDIKRKRETSSKRLGPQTDVDVVYSSVVVTEQQNPQRIIEEKSEDVTYSSLAQQQ